MSKILGLDFGEKRIGIAISDEMAILASPLRAVQAEEALSEIVGIVAAESIETVVVGLPRLMDGELSNKAAEVTKFVELLKEKVDPAVKIELEDETGTSVLAEERLKIRKINFRQDKELVDVEAAVIILQAYLDEKKNF